MQVPVLERAQKIRCPRCSYEAVSLRDLEAHGVQAHATAGEALLPLLSSEEPEGLQPLESFSMSGIPEQLHPALSVPDADPTFWVNKQVGRFLRAVDQRCQKGEVVNVLLVGPTGTGKSSLPREFAATRKRQFFTMHCQVVTEQGDWWGSKEMSAADGTYFRKAAMVDAVETPGSVILLDEANRTHPENLNALFGLLDHRRSVWIPALEREVVVAPGVTFFVTLNEGFDYVGTNSVDKALRDRMSNTIRLEYLPASVEMGLLVRRIGVDEETARGLSEFAQTVRKNPKLGMSVSTRQLLECAALVKEGLPVQDAVLFAVANGATEDVDKKAILQALQVSGGIDAAYVSNPAGEEE